MVKKYFLRANTSSGCVNLADSNLKNIRNIYSISGTSKTAKSLLISAIASHFDLSGSDVEIFYSPFDITKPDGVIVPEKSFAAVDAVCSSCSDNICTDEFLNFNRLEITRDCLAQLSELSENAYASLYSEYSIAKKIHDEWEKLYITDIDFDRLEGYGNGIINQLFDSSSGKKGEFCQRFFGASTMDGSVNYIDSITAGLERRYFIKGRPGTGKSTFLKRLNSTANNKGFDTEVYYCSFDKNSLDMVLIPGLSLCVFDSTAPHELFPERDGDSILDFYTEGGLSGFDETHEKELILMSRRYSFRIYQGIANLRRGVGYEREREFYLSRIIDDDAISRLADKIIRKVQ